MPVIIIAGAASGLGFAFLKHYATDPRNTIWALDRAFTPEKQQEISNLSPDVFTHILDVSFPTSVKAFVDDNRERLEYVDLVIHSAGVRGAVPALETTEVGSLASAETLHAMNLETLVKTFTINAAGTFLLLQALISPLRRAAQASEADPSRAPPKVIVMSSRMGSLDRNVGGGAYAYRASKAAQNMLVRSLSVDVPEVTFVLLHPGRVETGLVKYKEEGAIPAEESVAGMVTFIARIVKENTGRFYDRFGVEIPW